MNISGGLGVRFVPGPESFGERVGYGMPDFFDKVKQGIDKGMNMVSVKSKEVLETGKLKSRIGSLEEQLKQSFPELGTLVYGMFATGQFDEAAFREKCEAIAAFEKEIQIKKAELKQIRLKAQEEMGKLFCANCRAELGPDAKYCSRCGTQVETKTEDASSTG